jgi:hypothetical protein
MVGASTDGKHAFPVMAAPSKQRRHMNETDKPVVTLELLAEYSTPNGRGDWREEWTEEVEAIPSQDELRGLLKQEAEQPGHPQVMAVKLSLWSGNDDRPLNTLLWTDSQEVVRRYYAAIAEDREGPAWGVGETKDEAKENARQWGFDDGGVVIEITEDSYAKILAGDPQAVELAE